MTHEKARALLDAYYEARRDEVECPEWTKPGELRKYETSEKACLDAMTQPAATIAEQQREIERLKGFFRSMVEHAPACIASKFDDLPCTCGLDEVLK